MAKFWQSVEVIVMTDIQRAMLGDHDAAARLTEQGVLIPCCGNPPILKFHFGIKAWTVECAVNGHIHNTGLCSTKERAIDAWNTRAPILSAEEIETLNER